MKKIMPRGKYFIIFDIFVAAIIIVSVGFLLIDHLSHSLEYIPTNLIFIFCTLVSLFLGTFYLHIKHPINVSDFGFDSKGIRNTVMWGIKGGLVLILLNFPYKVVFGGQNIPQEHFIEAQQGMHFVFLFLIIAVIIIPFVEELFYRGFIFRLVRSNFGLVSGYMVSTGCFALGHMFSTPSIINSLILCYLYEKTGRIGASSIAHVLLNLFWYAGVYTKGGILTA